MPSFEVETYKVSVAANVNDSAQPRLFMVSPDLSHGIRNRATILFESVTSGLRTHNAIGVVTNVGGLNFNGINVIAWMSPSMFDEVYDIVRNEEPITVTYTYKDVPDQPSSTTKYLTSIKIGTDDELPGEGSPDTDVSSLESLALELVSAGNGAV